jgi:hypothetical protein
LLTHSCVPTSSFGRRSFQVQIFWGLLQQGLPDGIFSNKKNPNSGIFWRALEWKMLIQWPFGIIDSHLVYLITIW